MKKKAKFEIEIEYDPAVTTSGDGMQRAFNAKGIDIINMAQEGDYEGLTVAYLMGVFLSASSKDEKTAAVDKVRSIRAMSSAFVSAWSMFAPSGLDVTDNEVARLLKSMTDMMCQTIAEGLGVDPQYIINELQKEHGVTGQQEQQEGGEQQAGTSEADLDSLI